MIPFLTTRGQKNNGPLVNGYGTHLSNVTGTHYYTRERVRIDVNPSLHHIIPGYPRLSQVHPRFMYTDQGNDQGMTIGQLPDTLICSPDIRGLYAPYRTTREHGPMPSKSLQEPRTESAVEGLILLGYLLWNYMY